MIAVASFCFGLVLFDNSVALFYGVRLVVTFAFYVLIVLGLLLWICSC